MKKLLFGIFAVAAIAMSMVSCSKEVFVNGTVAFSATAPSEASWSGKEKIVFFVGGTPAATIDAVQGNTTDCTAAFTDLPESGTIYAASPFDESESGVNAVSSSKLDITIPTSQTSRNSYVDADAQILLGSCNYASSLPATETMAMKSIVANVKLVVTNSPEAIKNVTLTFPSKVAGKFNYALGTGAWTEAEASEKLTVKAATGSEGKTLYFACAPVALSGNVTAEFTGAATGAKYAVTIPAADLDLTSGSQVTVSVEIPLQLYLVGSAVGKEDAADAIAMTKKDDGSFTWTGDLAAESEFKLLLDKANANNAFTVGDAYNQIKYSTKATATPFENAKAGNYTINVWPEHAHIQMIRHFDHVLAAADNVGPMFNEFDEDHCEVVPGHPHEWETRFGCIWQNHGYDTFGINDEFKLSGPNSYWLGASFLQTDMNQGRIIRSGDWAQPIAVEGKTYTIYLQMMYEGETPEETVVVRIEGAIGGGGGYEADIRLENGVPQMITFDYTADGTWGGCTNMFIYFHKLTAPISFFLDGLNIGYDD